MDDLSWLAGLPFLELKRREHDWVFTFGRQTHLDVACLWRLCESSRICCTSSDDGHQFGLPAPRDSEAEVNVSLAQALVESVALRQGTLDLSLLFNTGQILEVIPDSEGYEAWQIGGVGKLIIAVGGGRLDVFIQPPEGR